MSEQPSEFDPELEIPVLHDSGSGSAFAGGSIDTLLTDHAAEQSDGPAEAPPFAGVWLGVAIGIALWAAIAGVVLLVQTG